MLAALHLCTCIDKAYVCIHKTGTATVGAIVYTCMYVLLYICIDKAYICIHKTGGATVGVQLYTYTYIHDMQAHVHTRSCTYAYIGIHDVPLKKDHLPLHAPLEAQTISRGGQIKIFFEEKQERRKE